MAKKELIVYNKDRSSLYSLKWAGGGEVPEVLSGEFTSQHAAISARDRYFESKLPKPPRFPNRPIRPKSPPVTKDTKAA